MDTIKRSHKKLNPDWKATLHAFRALKESSSKINLEKNLRVVAKQFGFEIHEDPFAGIPKYDPLFGDDRKCKCDHPYDRHFDSWDRMRPIGCKYCGCHVWQKP